MPSFPMQKQTHNNQLERGRRQGNLGEVLINNYCGGSFVAVKYKQQKLVDIGRKSVIFCMRPGGLREVFGCNNAFKATINQQTLKFYNCAKVVNQLKNIITIVGRVFQFVTLNILIF